MALLFSIADYVDRLTDKATVSCTDTPCQWSQARRESVPALVKDLDYRHEKSKPKPPVPLPEYYKPLYNATDQNISGVKESIKKLCQSVHPGALFLTLTDASKCKETPPTLRQLVSSFKKCKESGDFITFCIKNTPAAHIEFMENLSQADPIWKTMREGRITASLAGDIRRLKPASIGKSLTNRILGNTQIISVPAVDHGKKYEVVARELYRALASKLHKNLLVEEFGLFVDITAPVLGASPDGIITCKCHEKESWR